MRTNRNKRIKEGLKMLETVQERIKLLKAGVLGDTIEKLYIDGNNMKIIKGNLLYSNEVSNDK